MTSPQLHDHELIWATDIFGKNGIPFRDPSIPLDVFRINIDNAPYFDDVWISCPICGVPSFHPHHHLFRHEKQRLYRFM